MLGGKAHIGQHILFRLVEKAGELGKLWVGDPSPLCFGGLGAVLSESGGDESRDDPPAALAGMSERIAHDVDAAALPGRAHQLRDGGLDALVGLGDDELDAPEAAASEFARGNSVQKASASEGPMSMPSTSRWPPALTPTATITATETI